jgi:hypothetical protein
MAPTSVHPTTTHTRDQTHPSLSSASLTSLLASSRSKTTSRVGEEKNIKIPKPTPPTPPPSHASSSSLLAAAIVEERSTTTAALSGASRGRSQNRSSRSTGAACSRLGGRPLSPALIGGAGQQGSGWYTGGVRAGDGACEEEARGGCCCGGRGQVEGG